MAETMSCWLKWFFILCLAAVVTHRPCIPAHAKLTPIDSDPERDITLIGEWSSLSWNNEYYINATNASKCWDYEVCVFMPEDEKIWLGDNEIHCTVIRGGPFGHKKQTVAELHYVDFVGSDLIKWQEQKFPPDPQWRRVSFKAAGCICTDWNNTASFNGTELGPGYICGKAKDASPRNSLLTPPPPSPQSPVPDPPFPDPPFPDASFPNQPFPNTPLVPDPPLLPDSPLAPGKTVAPIGSAASGSKALPECVARLEAAAQDLEKELRVLDAEGRRLKARENERLAEKRRLDEQTAMVLSHQSRMLGNIQNLSKDEARRSLELAEQLRDLALPYEAKWGRFADELKRHDEKVRAFNAKRRNFDSDKQACDSSTRGLGVGSAAELGPPDNANELRLLREAEAWSNETRNKLDSLTNAVSPKTLPAPEPPPKVPALNPPKQNGKTLDQIKCEVTGGKDCEQYREPK